jgi:hypothetical protein
LFCGRGYRIQRIDGRVYPDEGNNDEDGKQVNDNAGSALCPVSANARAFGGKRVPYTPNFQKETSMSPEQPPITWDALREWARLFADYHRYPKL